MFYANTVYGVWKHLSPPGYEYKCLWVTRDVEVFSGKYMNGPIVLPANPKAHGIRYVRLRRSYEILKDPANPGRPILHPVDAASPGLSATGGPPPLASSRSNAAPAVSRVTGAETKSGTKEDERAARGVANRTVGRPVAPSAVPIRLCDLAGRDLPSAGLAESLLRTVNYVARLRTTAAAERIAVFKEVEGQYFDTRQINNPFAGTDQAFVSAKSFKSLKQFSLKNASSARDVHIVRLDLPAGFSPDVERSALTYRLRIVASRAALNLVDLPRLSMFADRDREKITVEVVWDEIVAGGSLASPKTFTGFAELDREVESAPTYLSDDEVGRLFDAIRDRLVEQDFDRLIIAKESWSAPIAAASAVMELVARKARQGMRGKWFAVYSARTAAFGNAYLMAAVNRSGAGRIHEQGSGELRQPIPAARQLWHTIGLEAESRERRAERAVSVRRDQILTDANVIAESTGQIIPKRAYRKLIAALEDVARLLGSTSHQQSEAIAQRPVSQLLEQKVPKIRLPKTATDAFRQRNKHLVKTDRDEIIRTLSRVRDGVAARLAEGRCQAVYVTDAELFLVEGSRVAGRD